MAEEQTRKESVRAVYTEVFPAHRLLYISILNLSKIPTVIGATGTQGGSVVAAALSSGNYKIRVVTRAINSDTSKVLMLNGVVVVVADWNDEQSLVKTSEGSYAIYVETDFWDSFVTQSIEDTIELEAKQGINMGKAAA
ncbi:hypothetical protein PENANT_c013G04728 [Penicillium antarcticum]|uniref:NmrA-like domain-containing protein n=1 Tax=Penicillium antarcticum TaxID=416450 RepID=A0A1V6Q5S1_9EURO|nr:hypothetical protein PENANT_c013G04728 [Penicillium antarcticum]